jgi:hypothetical protein
MDTYAKGELTPEMFAQFTAAQDVSSTLSTAFTSQL